MKLHDGMTRRWIGAIMCTGMICGLSGCLRLHHRPTAPVLPPVLTPIALETLPPPKEEPMVPEPQVTLPPVPIAAAAATPHRERRHIVPKATAAAAPVEETATPEPMTDEAAIGDLTAGGATNPQAQQGAADLIRSIENRLNGLPAQTVRKQRSQVNRVRNFWKQAHEALNSGDIEGATTLATKAKLLLDDLEKLGGQE